MPSLPPCLPPCMGLCGKCDCPRTIQQKLNTAPRHAGKLRHHVRGSTTVQIHFGKVRPCKRTQYAFFRWGQHNIQHKKRTCSSTPNKHIGVTAYDTHVFSHWTHVFHYWTHLFFPRVLTVFTFLHRPLRRHPLPRDRHMKSECKNPVQ